MSTYKNYSDAELADLYYDNDGDALDIATEIAYRDGQGLWTGEEYVAADALDEIGA